MPLIANVVWIIFGGLVTAFAWWVAGCVLCVTVVGIPLGLQAFKMARLTLAPFGVDVTYGGGAPSTVANIVWLVLCGLWMALAYLVLGCLYCITIIGIPIGLQLFKMARLSLMPFGAEITPR
ncbi:MAG: YccF domain-containing protein [Coriobacteriaceae bacterium]|nr:YccF domain-containing protein [Coriobacteriaceae bacterium]